jgi:hypothetical protein
MSSIERVLIYVGSILAIGALGFIIYNQVNISKQQTAIQQQVIAQKTLIDGIVASSNTYTTKTDLDNFIQQNTNDLKTIQANLSSLGATITAANVFSSDSTSQVASNLPSSSTGTTNPSPPPTPTVVNCPNGGTVNCPNTDPYGYQKSQQILALTEDFSNVAVPLGSVSFSSWQADPWAKNIIARQYNVVSVIGTDENQRAYVDNKFTITAGGNTYTVPITTDQTQQTYPANHMSWWNPQLFGGVSGGAALTKLQGEFVASANFGFVSYGKYKNSPQLSIGQVGIGYAALSKKPVLTITPIAFNLGGVVPLIHNTYVAPEIDVSSDGTIYGAAGLRLAF